MFRRPRQAAHSPLQLFQVRRTVPSAEDVRPDLDDGQVTNAARVVGQVALYREFHLSGVGHTIGSPGRLEFRRQTQPDLSHLLAQQPVQLLAVLHPDQLLGGAPLPAAWSAP